LRELNASVFNNIQQWVLECFNTTRLVGEPSIAEATRSFPVLNNTTPGKLYTALVITRKCFHIFGKSCEYIDSQPILRSGSTIS
jgi:origin recognition complex subunit 3